MPPDDFDTLSPADYFAKIFGDKIFLKLGGQLEETNLYSAQKCGSNINANLKEMQQFFGTNILMSVVMPDFCAVMTNLSKVIDYIFHELLIAKLNAYGFDEASLKVIISYLKNRTQITKVGASFNELLNIIYG